jgi:histidinol-phosphate aminotransferase
MIETAQTNPRIKLIFVCSPGNPTAKAISKTAIRTLAMACATTALIVVDEAYVDFCPTSSSLELVYNNNNYDDDDTTTVLPNVCILQTLSKAFGLANVRCGFLFAAPDVIALLNNVKAPYNMNGLTSQTAMAAFDHIATVQHNVQALVTQRTIVMKALQSMTGIVDHVFPSDANFILFRLTDEYNAEGVYKRMADQGIVTRFRGTELHCHNCIRVTVGTDEENQAFLTLFQETTRQLQS